MSGEPRDPNEKPPDDPTLAEEALSRLEERLDRASEMAERLIIEAAARAAGDTARGGEPAEGVEGSQGSQGSQDSEGGAEERRASERRAGERRAGEGKPPPAGWQRREHARDPESRARSETDLLFEVLSSLRDRIPPELQRRLGEALREVLLALRALIDWYLERTERRRKAPVEVEDIPIV
jgi:hypothetical protein